MLARNVGRKHRESAVSVWKDRLREGANGVGVETPCLVDSTSFAVQEVWTFWDLGALSGEDGARRDVKLG